MIKKSFKTLKENPVIFLGFAIPIVLLALTMIPMLFSISGLTDIIIQSANNGIEPAASDMFRFMGSYLISFLLIIVVGLVIGLVIIPPVLNKVYEVCTNRNEPGWIKRGLKRSWWKIIVTIFIIGAASSMIVFIALFVILIPIIGYLIYLAFILALSVYALIAYTAVIAEDDYRMGLSNIFKVGSRYFFKLLGTTVLVSIPTIILSIVLSGSMITKILSSANAFINDLMVIELMTDGFGLFFVIMLIIYIYYIFAGAFIYTYSMHQYLHTKNSFQSPLSNSASHPSQNIKSFSSETDENA